MSSHEAPRFFCDAMLGGLARWLRAAGYDAAFEHGIDDGELVRRSLAEGRILLSSDSGIFQRNLITSGQVRSLFVPRGLSKLGALNYVANALKLPLRRPSRCMKCNGRLEEVPKHAVAGEAPPLAFRNCRRFWRCTRCGKLLWRATHWEEIQRRLREIFSDSTSAGKDASG